uniref:Choline/carnitine acyltransferase domain-containing protein n=1 Tax=Amblyomma maculatum TaxID=34609 RepID=G3MPS7_AMBMU
MLRAGMIRGSLACVACARGKMVNEFSKNVSLRPASTAVQMGLMMSKQRELKKLPVPPLKETLQMYVKSIKPLVTSGQLEKTLKVVQEFAEPNGIGAKLYRILESKAASTENWLADWWLEGAYLSYRMPVVVYSNPAMALPKQTFTQKDGQLKHAALLIAGALDFKALIERQQLEPEMMGKDPLDMSQYQKIFSTCRVPGYKQDRLETYFLSDSPPTHVLVIYNNEFFAVDVYDGQGNPYDEDQILQQLRQVVNMSTSAGAGVGILTSEHRDVWAKAFDELCKNPCNAESLEFIKKAILVVCLDKKLKVKDPYEVACAYQMLLGGRHGENAANRWCDKTVQLIVGEDGYTGLLYEHSPSEGPPVAVLVDHCYKYIDKKQGSPQTRKAADNVPRKLEFELSADTIKDIEKAHSSLSRLTADLDLFIYKYRGYGKEVIKSFKLSPDSYIQMAMQLAYYKIHKAPGATYESASTRKFIHGRTETIRSTSSESLEFCKAFESSETKLPEKVERLRKAVQNHKEYTNLAINGCGVDRLLFGLKMIAIENDIPVPEIYKDAAYKISTEFKISSSQVATQCDAVMFYGPLVKDGYGCCYNPQGHTITFGLSSFNSSAATSTAKFRDALEESLTQMHDCLRLSLSSKL